jgi:hypothetical protein
MPQGKKERERRMKKLREEGIPWYPSLTKEERIEKAAEQLAWLFVRQALWDAKRKNGGDDRVDLLL